METSFEIAFSTHRRVGFNGEEEGPRRISGRPFKFAVAPLVLYGNYVD